MTRPLDSDQLGKKGQDRFSELCVDAGLFPNPSTWDGKGWGFVVDWRHDPATDNYDARPTLRSCLMQVKTIWRGGRKVRLPLLAIEHLAKALEPAFVAVLEVDNDFQVAALHLAHLEGAFLGTELKALRQARADRKALGKINLVPSLGRRFTCIEATGSGLRTALEHGIGASLGAYAGEKQKQLEKLGFEKDAREISLTFSTDNAQQIAQAVLGLRPIDVVVTAHRGCGWSGSVEATNQDSTASISEPAHFGRFV